MPRYAICNETFGDWSLDRALSFAKEVGYTGWEVAPFMLNANAREISRQQRIDYRQAVETAGFEIVGLHWLLAKTNGFHLTTADATVRHNTAEYLIELVQLCADLGGSLMVLGSPQQRNVAAGMSQFQAMQHAADVLRNVAPTLETKGIKLLLEPLGPQEGNFLNTADAARELAELIDSPQVGLHLDVKAMSTEPTPIPEIIARHADWLVHFHANDPNRQGPGMGDVDFRPILRALRNIEYEGWISVEVFDYEPGVERLVTASMANLLAAAPRN